MAAKQEEQLSALDAMLTQTDEPAETPAPESEEVSDAQPVEAEPQVETPAPIEEPVETAPETPVAEAEAPAPPSEPVASEPQGEPATVRPKTDKVSRQVVERYSRKLQAERQENERLRQENERLRQTQAKEVDPLATWQADPESEGVPPSKELLGQHDAFVAAKARQEAVAAASRPVVDQATLERADAMIDAAPPAQRVITSRAFKAGWYTQDEMREIALSPDPAAKAFEIGRDLWDAFGDDKEQAFVNQLFPPKVTAPKPQRAAQPQRPAAPKAPAPAPKPKPQSQETTDEDVIQPFEKNSHAARVMEHMFRGT